MALGDTQPKVTHTQKQSTWYTKSIDIYLNENRRIEVTTQTAREQHIHTRTIDSWTIMDPGPSPRAAAACTPGPAPRNLQKDPACLPSARTYGKPMEKLWKTHVRGGMGGTDCVVPRLQRGPWCQEALGEGGWPGPAHMGKRELKEELTKAKTEAYLLGHSRQPNNGI